MNSEPVQPGGVRATRALRIVLFACLVLGVEWRFADPITVARDPELWPIPYSMLFLCFPLGLGVWAFEKTSRGPSAKSDALWSVLAGTLTYVVLSLIGRL